MLYYLMYYTLECNTLSALFKLLRRVSRKPSEKDQENVDLIGAAIKNRYPNKIPCKEGSSSLLLYNNDCCNNYHH